MKIGHQDYGIIIDDQDRIVGINCGWDFAAEHETGIKDIKEMFGIDQGRRMKGLDKRTITRVPHENMYYICANPKAPSQWYCYSSKYTINRIQLSEIKPERIMEGQYKDWLEFQKNPKKWEKRGYKPKQMDIAAEWSWNGFNITAYSERGKEALELVYQAMLKKDLVIMTGGKAAAFGNAGLVFGIRSMLGSDIDKLQAYHDQETYDCEDYQSRTGIEAKLKKSGKKWFYLGAKKQKDGSFYFWLNPMEQDKYNTGHFTLDELEMWADNEGPVVKK